MTTNEMTPAVGVTQLETYVQCMNSVYRLLHDQPMTLEQALQRARDVDALRQVLEKAEKQR